MMCALIKCSDISNEIRPKNIAKRWAHLVIEEFFAQSDLERESVYKKIEKNNI